RRHGLYELPDALAGFPSEAQLQEPEPETIFDEHMVSPLVEPSEADRLRLFPPPQPLRIPVQRLSRGAGLILVTLAGGFIVASIVLLVLTPAPNESKTDAPLSTVSSQPAVATPPPTRDLASSFLLAPAPSVESPPPGVEPPLDSVKRPPASARPPRVEPP